jgi:hypothetical protein
MTFFGTALAPAGAATGSSSGGGAYRPGAPGAGDDYFPLHGNGGYDVKHYLLKVSYDPATDRLTGVATISARATQNLSRFNLDFFRILRAWTTRRADGHGTIPQFIMLAERVSGEQLDELFRVWLFTGSKPALEAAAGAAARTTAGDAPAASLLEGLKQAQRLRR